MNIGDLKKNIAIKYHASGHVSDLRPETHACTYGDLKDCYRKGSRGAALERPWAA